MPQVLNRSKNASALINGVAFTQVKNGMLSDEITQEQADYFLSIPNYVAVKAAPVKAAPVADTSAADVAAAETAAREAAAAEAAAREAAETANAAAAAAAAQKQQA